MQAINIWEVLAFLLLSVCAQTQPMDTQKVVRSYDVIIEEEKAGRLEYAAMSDADKLRVLVVPFSADSSRGKERLSATLSIEDGLRVLEDVHGEEGPVTNEPVVLPDESESLMASPAMILPFVADKQYDIELISAAGGSLTVQANLQAFGSGDNLIQVARDSEGRILNLRAHLPVVGSVELRFVPDEVR